MENKVKSNAEIELSSTPPVKVSMEKKFKSFLETEFKAIPPTKASMDYRIEMLHNLLDYAQELKIKGMDDEDVIYDLSIKKLGDVGALLRNFEDKRVYQHKTGKKNLAAIIVTLSIIVPAFLGYLVAGVVVKESIWGWSWIILMFGIFATVTVLLMLYMINSKSTNKAKLINLSVLTIIALWTVFVALVLMLLKNYANVSVIDKWWVVFIALPALLLTGNAIVDLAVNAKSKWSSLAVAILLIFIMSYVIIGLTVPNFWHPGWLMVIAGVFGAVLELGIVFGIKSRKAKAERVDKNAMDDKYYTEW